MTKTLLQTAKKVKLHSKIAKRVDDEVLELTLGWLFGEVSYTQARKALKVRGSQPYAYFANAIKKAVKENRVVIKLP